MRNSKRKTFVVDELETRSLLSGFHHPGGLLNNPSPAVQADLTKIQTDRQTLQKDITTPATRRRSPRTRRPSRPTTPSCRRTCRPRPPRRRARLRPVPPRVRPRPRFSVGGSETSEIHLQGRPADSMT